MVSVYIKGDASLFVKSLRVFTLAESLGGFESLVEIPSLMTHMSVPPDQRAQLGITDNLVSAALAAPRLVLTRLTVLAFGSGASFLRPGGCRRHRR